ncbi:EAL and HDOD domain-containing protein [Neptuniibacter sp.]|uniref:EAL and HDOD domain-containing protein n=1 Tax=Neptuniibacter sp. TaxID=1962643 RepID=UPI002605C8B3|nr:HDOD domain-containing protein [Neptuniibacter sp.]MCP4596596.1 HDOD domain-containing protein [Neptuniibacter sp.]
MDVLLSTYCNVLENGHLRLLPAYINFEAEWLYDKDLPLVPQESLVLEVHEMEDKQDHNYQQLHLLNENGYQIALDNYDENSSLSKVISSAKVIKVNIRDFRPEKLKEHINELRQHDVMLLAQKIETYQEFELCRELGFELFQGYFFARPQLVKGRKLNHNDTVILELLGALSNDEATFKELEQVISKDPELSVGILKIVNSSRFRRVRHITRISEAIALIGLQELKKWALLLSMRKTKNKPSELMSNILVCAKTCEEVAKRRSDVDPSSAFLVGLLSGIEALLDLPTEIILTQMPVSIDIKNALLGRSNSLGDLLREVNSYMTGSWDMLADERQNLQLAADYEQATLWNQEIQQQLV